MYRVAIIGCGNIGSLYSDDPKIKGIYTHAAAYSACSETKLVAVCDPDIVKAKKASEKWNCASYTDYKKILEEQKPDIVSICTPDNTHASILNDILNSQEKVLAVIIEKPIALDLSQATQLIELAKLHKVILVVNYSRRYSSQLMQVKEMVSAGKLGKIQKISGYYTKGILHNGTHWLDLATLILGELKSVQGFMSRDEDVLDPTLDAQLIFNNGTVGFLQGLAAEHYSLFEMDILGTEGRIRILDSGHLIEFYEVKESQYYSGYKAVIKNSECESDMYNTLLHAVLDLVDCLKTNRIPKCSGQDGLYVLNIGLTLIESARQGGKNMTVEKIHV